MNTTRRRPVTEAAPRYKTVLFTWAAAFPLLTALNVLLGPLLLQLPLPGRTLLLTGLLINLHTYVVVPAYATMRRRARSSRIRRKTREESSTYRKLQPNPEPRHFECTTPHI